jgi:hypothetical protein
MVPETVPKKIISGSTYLDALYGWKSGGSLFRIDLADSAGMYA